MLRGSKLPLLAYVSSRTEVLRSLHDDQYGVAPADYGMGNRPDVQFPVVDDPRRSDGHCLSELPGRTTVPIACRFLFSSLLGRYLS